MDPKPRQPERKDNGEESVTPIESPMTRFKRFAARLVSVSREELREAERFAKPKGDI